MNNAAKHDRFFSLGGIANMFILLALVLVLGCQGQPSEKPPIHINPNMDVQPKYRPQSYSPFFPDHATMRMPVEGTVARGELFEDTTFQFGVDPISGKPVEKSPLPITMEGLQRGRERFNIYCSACHGQVGDGTGLIVKRGYVLPPSYHTDQIRGYSDGRIFEIITNGIRNMPSYADQIPVRDRWLIVSYVRALQLSQYAAYSDLPEEVREKLK